MTERIDPGTNRISVLMTVYNEAATLEPCLRSILSQTEPDFELVVVDDGSTDGSAEILEQYAREEARIRIVTFPKNKGIVAALNRGLAACKGRWIARMDADDLMEPKRLARQKEYAVRNPEIDLWGARVTIFRDGSAPTPGQIRYQDWSNRLLDDAAMKRELFVESPIMHPTFFAGRAVFQRLGGYRDHPWAEDYDFLFRATAMGFIFGKVPEVLVHKRDSPTRLYRTDPRCKRPAMFRAKAHYFAKSFSHHGRSLIVAGTGSSGRQLARSLLDEGLAIAGFTDQREGPPNRTVMGLPVYRGNIEGLTRLTAEKDNLFFLSAIGNREGAEFLEHFLIEKRMRAEKDYLRFL